MVKDTGNLVGRAQRRRRSALAMQRAYTLIEVYIVLCALGVIAAFVMPVLAPATVPAPAVPAARR